MKDYEKEYKKLIKKARKRQLKGFCERHHIIPRCMGGGNEPENIVKLTTKEHYWAHYLLAKIHPNNEKLRYAFYMMCTQKHDYRESASVKLIAAAKYLMRKYEYNRKTKRRKSSSH